MTPEQQAHVSIDALLTAAGWTVFDVADANIRASTGVAIQEVSLKPGHGFADYLLYNLPAPEVIAQEIVDDLEAALEQFRLIAGDLNGTSGARET